MKTIYIKDFAIFPGPRTKDLGKNSGEEFRDNILIPALLENETISVNFDGVFGYGSSFLEEAFGGLVRKNVDKNKIIALRENLVSESDSSVVSEVRQYIDNALQKNK